LFDCDPYSASPTDDILRGQTGVAQTVEESPHQAACIHRTGGFFVFGVLSFSYIFKNADPAARTLHAFLEEKLAVLTLGSVFKFSARHIDESPHATTGLHGLDRASNPCSKNTLVLLLLRRAILVSPFALP
jgi:hypothetical protein